MKLEEVLPTLREGKIISRSNPKRETKWGFHHSFITPADGMSTLDFDDILADDWEIEDDQD